MPALLLAALLASPSALAADLDGDGVDAASDCDDSDPSVHPGATEGCDGVDNNCDGRVDEGLLGLAMACAAESCGALAAADPAAVSADYYLDLGEGPQLMVCELDDGVVSALSWESAYDLLPAELQGSDALAASENSAH